MQWELPAEPQTLEGVSGEQVAEACERKDANEVLMRDGANALRLCIDQAEPLPIRGLFRWHTAIVFTELSVFKDEHRNEHVCTDGILRVFFEVYDKPERPRLPILSICAAAKHKSARHLLWFNICY